MKILVVTWIDAANLAIENIVRKMVERGHKVDIYACYTDHKSIRMFHDLPINIFSINELSDKKIKGYDIAFTVDLAMRTLRFADIYVFSYNYVPDTWISEGADFMFTMVNDRKLQYEEDCAIMPIGCVKNDKKIKNVNVKKQILYLDAGHNPFGIKAKNQVAEMILNVCNKFPDYSIVVKPRWLTTEKLGQSHRSGIHIYNVINELTDGKLPNNLIMLDEHRDLQELIDESESVITTSISCYFDIALRGKGCIIVDGFDGEEGYDTRPSIANAYENAKDSGCCVNYKNVLDYLPQGIICNNEHLNDRIPYRQNVSDKILDVMEYVFHNFIKFRRYPDINKYYYDTYSSCMTNNQKITLDVLKEKRFKNGALIIMRLQEHIKCNIDKKELFDKISEDYVKYPLNQKGYNAFLDHIEYERKLICVKNKSVMQNDAIDQAIYFQALYDTGQGDEILLLNIEDVLCVGPYHYYLGMIYAKYNQVHLAIKEYVLFLEEALERSYDKYPQENVWGIRNAFNYIFSKFDEDNIEHEKLAYLCLKLSERDASVVEYRNRKRAYNYLPILAEEISATNLELAYACLELHTKKMYPYELYERDEKKKEIERIKNSISYKLGRTMTFPLREVRRKSRIIRKNGIKSGLQKREADIKNQMHNLKMKCGNQNIIRIWKVFHKKIIGGYKIYKQYEMKYGTDMHLYLSATSRGDAYILGGFWDKFLSNREKKDKPIFVVWNKNSIEVAQLFRIENIESTDTEGFQALINLLMFDSKAIIPIDILHYHLFYRHTGIFGFIMGLHGFNLLSISAAAMGVAEEEMTEPHFVYDKSEVDKLFVDYKLIPGKTIVLSPYAKTVREIPKTFWLKLICRLTESGFSLCTNVFGEEQALPGTVPIYIPFQQSVAFLEKAGATIGIRSGFQDVTSTADCLKVSVIWENLPTPYRCCSVDEAFNLQNMYHNKNQYDYVYNLQKEDYIIDDIIGRIISYFAKTDTCLNEKK